MDKPLKINTESAERIALGSRLKELYLALEFKNGRQFALDLGIDPSQMSKIEKGQLGISMEVFKEIVSKYSVNPAWLLKGDGENMFEFAQSKLLSFHEQLAAKKANNEWIGLPVYNVPISASFVHTYRDELYAPEFYLQDRKYIDCDFAAIIRGDSMHSEVRHGDYVICKNIKDYGFISYGEIYYVVANNGLETCKYLHPHPTDADKFLLVPYNKSIPPSPLPKKYIDRLYKVRGIIRAY